MFEKFFAQMKLIELYEKILDSITSGVIVVNEDRKIMYANSHLKRAYGNIIGKDFCKQVLGMEELPKDWPIAKTLEDGRPHESEVITRNRHLSIKSYPLKDGLKKRHAVALIEETTYKKPFEFLMKSEATMLKNLAENNQKLLKEYNNLRKKMLSIAKKSKKK